MLQLNTHEFFCVHTILHFITLAFLTPLPSSLQKMGEKAHPKNVEMMAAFTFTSAKEVPVDRRLKSSKATTCGYVKQMRVSISIQRKKQHSMQITYFSLDETSLHVSVNATCALRRQRACFQVSAQFVPTTCSNFQILPARNVQQRTSVTPAVKKYLSSKSW